MATKPIDELGRTTLTWPEYQKQANKLLKKVPRGENWQKYLTKELGTGFWEHEGVKVDYGFNRAHGKLKRKRKTVRTANQQQSRITREANEQFTDITSQEAAKDWKKKNITDWNNKNNPTGKKLVKGTEDYNKYFRRYEHRIKVSDPFWKGDTGLDYLSGDPENLTWTTKSQWDLKDAGEMKHGKDFIFDVDQYTGDVSYTPRKGFKAHEAVFDKFEGAIDHTSKLIPTQLAKRAKVAAIGAGALLPGGLGTAASAAEVYERNKLYEESKSWLDRLQLGLAQASLLTGWTGAGEIIATPADLINLSIDAARYGTQATDTSDRKRYRHGVR